MNVLWWLVFNDLSISKEYYSIINFMYNTYIANNIDIRLIPSTELIQAFPNIAKLNNGIPTNILFWDKHWELAIELEKNGIDVVNNPRSCIICEDKIATLRLLNKHIGIIPNTNFIHKSMSDNQLREESEKIGFPLIVKYKQSVLGNSVFLVKSFEQLKHFVFSSTDTEMAIQEYLSYSPETDLKLFVTKDSILSCMKRTRIGKTYLIEPHIATDKEKNIAIQSCNICDMPFAGVDIIYKNATTPLICELNTQPNLINIINNCNINVLSILLQRYFQ